MTVRDKGTGEEREEIVKSPARAPADVGNRSRRDRYKRVTLRSLSAAEAYCKAIVDAFNETRTLGENEREFVSVRKETNR
jgi:hypothetical protein